MARPSLLEWTRYRAPATQSDYQPFAQANSNHPESSDEYGTHDEIEGLARFSEGATRGLGCG